VNRLISAVLFLGLVSVPALSGSSGGTWDEAAGRLPSLEPYVTLLDMHPVQESSYIQAARPIMLAMPHVIRQGLTTLPDPRQVEVPAVVTPEQRAEEDPGVATGKAGTGFFIASDGILLTAAHVVNGCGRMQIISKYVARTWVSLVAADAAHDVALLKAPDLRSPAMVRLAEAPPSGGKLFILGFPETASLTVPAETWAVPENDKFPANIGPMANPRDLLWMSAPEVTHGYSGGPIFDPRQGAVVGLVKGEVDGGYLRLVRDMPTTGVAIGPGIEHIAALIRREVPYASVSLASGEAGQDTLRRATVHVLCWH
jgi:S1-C subfamily serine protease